MNLPSPIEFVTSCGRQFAARTLILLKEGCGPLIAVIGLEMMILAAIYHGAGQ